MHPNFKMKNKQKKIEEKTLKFYQDKCQINKSTKNKRAMRFHVIMNRKDANVYL